MTQILHTDLAPSVLPHLSLARAVRLVRRALAPAIWLARGCGRALVAVVGLVGQSASMAYVDPFAQSRSCPSRPDHPNLRL